MKYSQHSTNHEKTLADAVSFRNPCGHWICRSCVPGLLRQIIDEFDEGKKLDEMKSSRCQHVMREGQLAGQEEKCDKSLIWLLKLMAIYPMYFREHEVDGDLSDLFSEFDKKLELSRPGRQICPHCEHIANYLNAREFLNVQCKDRSCGQFFCGKCGAAGERGKRCRHCDQKMEHPKYTVMNSLNTQYCPGCAKVACMESGAGFWRDCNKMICQGGCRKLFCIDCGKDISSNPYSHWQGSPYQPCGWLAPGQECRNPKKHDPNTTCNYCERGERKPQAGETFLAGPVDDRSMDFVDVQKRKIEFVATFRKKSDLKANHASFQIIENNLQKQAAGAEKGAEIVFVFEMVVADPPEKNGSVLFKFFIDRSQDREEDASLTLPMEPALKLKIWLRSWLWYNKEGRDFEWFIKK